MREHVTEKWIHEYQIKLIFIKKGFLVYHLHKCILSEHFRKHVKSQGLLAYQNWLYLFWTFGIYLNYSFQQKHTLKLGATHVSITTSTYTNTIEEHPTWFCYVLTTNVLLDLTTWTFAFNYSLDSHAYG